MCDHSAGSERAQRIARGTGQSGDDQGPNDPGTESFRAPGHGAQAGLDHEREAQSRQSGVPSYPWRESESAQSAPDDTIVNALGDRVARSNAELVVNSARL